MALTPAQQRIKDLQALGSANRSEAEASGRTAIEQQQVQQSQQTQLNSPIVEQTQINPVPQQTNVAQVDRGNQPLGDLTGEQKRSQMNELQLSASQGGRVAGVQQSFNDQGQVIPKGDAISQQFGAGSLDRQSVGLAGQLQALPGEVSGAEKALKDRAVFGNFAEPTSFADAAGQMTFDLEADRMVMPDGADPLEFELTKAKAARVEVEQALSKAVQVDQKRQINDYIKNNVGREVSAGEPVGYDRISADDEILEYNIRYKEQVEEGQRVLNERKQEVIDARFAKLGNLTGKSEELFKKQIAAQVEKDFAKKEADYVRKLDTSLAGQKRVLERQQDKAEADFNEKIKKIGIDSGKSISKRKEDEKLSYIEREQLKNPNLTSSYLASKFDALQKYDAKGEKEAMTGNLVDGILEEEQDIATVFGKVFDSNEDVKSTFDAIKSRRGEAYAKKAKQEYLRTKGYDEESIMQDDYTDLVSGLYNGEDTSPLSLARLVKEGKTLGLPDEFVQSQLEVISQSPNVDVNTKIMAQTYLKSMTPEAKIMKSGDAIVSVTPEGVKELYRSGGSVNEGMLYENANNDEQMTVDRIVRGIPTQLKNSEKEIAMRQNEVLKMIRGGQDFQSIKDEFSGLVVMNEEDMPFANALRNLAIGSPDIDFEGISAGINRGDKIQPIIAVENAKMSKYDKEDFNQAKTALMVRKAQEVVDLIDTVGEDFMGAIDNRFFNADKVVRQRALEDAGIAEGDERFAAATKLASIMARLNAEERKSFGGTALTETEAEFLKPMIADMFDQPATAGIKMAELADNSLQKHNLYRQKEGLPLFRDSKDILSNESKIELYDSYAKEKFGSKEPTSQQIEVFEGMTREELQNFANKNPELFNSFREKRLKKKDNGTLDLIKKEEGFRDKAYQDSAGVWTIGYGFTEKNGQPIKPGDSMTQQEADNILPEKVKQYQNFNNKISVDLTPKQQEALTSFEYNLGSGIWDTTGKDIINAVNKGDLKKASSIMLAHNQAKDPKTGKLRPIKGLTNRRKREAELLTSSV